MSVLLLNPVTMVIVAALLPVFLLLWYIYYQDSAQPEPVKWLWKAVLYGVASAYLTLSVISPIPSLEVIAPAFAATIPGAICNAFCYAAIPEEAAKLLMLMILIRKNPYFDEHLDGIVYATCVGLGFAGLENILYLVNNLDDLATVAISRALFSVPGHFFFAVAMGYFVSLAHFVCYTDLQRKCSYALAFFVPMLLHGIFDALLMSMQVGGGFAGWLLLAFLVFVNWLRKFAVRRIKALKPKV